MNQRRKPPESLKLRQGTEDVLPEDSNIQYAWSNDRLLGGKPVPKEGAAVTAHEASLLVLRNTHGLWAAGLMGWKSRWRRAHLSVPISAMCPLPPCSYLGSASPALNWHFFVPVVHPGHSGPGQATRLGAVQGHVLCPLGQAAKGQSSFSRDRFGSLQSLLPRLHVASLVQAVSIASWSAFYTRCWHIQHCSLHFNSFPEQPPQLLPPQYRPGSPCPRNSALMAYPPRKQTDKWLVFLMPRKFCFAPVPYITFASYEATL